MVSYHVSVDDRQVRKALRKVMAAGRSLEPVWRLVGLERQRDARRRLRRRRGRFGASSGRLAHSITYRVSPLRLDIGTNLVYGAIQQLGGTVRPRSVRTLAIPMLPHLSQLGVWPRDLPRESMRFVSIDQGDLVGKLVRAGGEAPTENSGLVNSSQPGGVKRPRRFKVKTTAGETMYLLVRQSKIPGDAYLVFDHEGRRFLLTAAARHYTRAAAG